jgi:hypothetical protein
MTFSLRLSLSRPFTHSSSFINSPASFRRSISSASTQVFSHPHHPFQIHSIFLGKSQTPSISSSALEFGFRLPQSDKAFNSKETSKHFQQILSTDQTLDQQIIRRINEFLSFISYCAHSPAAASIYFRVDLATAAQQLQSINPLEHLSRLPIPLSSLLKDPQALKESFDKFSSSLFDLSSESETAHWAKRRIHCIEPGIVDLLKCNTIWIPTKGNLNILQLKRLPESANIFRQKQQQPSSNTAESSLTVNEFPISSVISELNFSFDPAKMKGSDRLFDSSSSSADKLSLALRMLTDFVSPLPIGRMVQVMSGRIFEALEVKK